MFFVFKQKTAYEMRISDWSSDVCSSDLLRHNRVFPDADFAMENPTSILIGADNLTPELAHADIAMPDLRHGKLHDMNAMKPPRHGDAPQFMDQDLIMTEKRIFADIRYFLIVLSEHIQARKQRTVETKP